MTLSYRMTGLALVLGLSVASGHSARAGGIDCTRAGSKTERLICASPELRQADTTLNRLYGIVRGAVPKSLGPALLAGQRAWLADRDRACGASACLTTRMAARLALFGALAARVSDANPTLPDLTGAWLDGSFRIEPPAPPGLQPASDLPASGSVLSFQPGALCTAGACASFGLEPQHLAAGPGREGLPALLGVAATAPFYLVYLDGKAAYGLVPLADGTLVAVSPGCGPTGDSCGYVRQIWRPEAPGTALYRESAAP